MATTEIDLTIYPYTVGRVDCKVLPRSFKTLAEAKAYLAKQDKAALEHGEFYLDGPDQENTVPNFCAAPMASPKPIVTPPVAADLAEVIDSEWTRTTTESQGTRGAWTHAIEELCRALESQKER